MPPITTADVDIDLAGEFTQLRKALDIKHNEFVALVEKASKEIAEQGKVSDTTRGALETVGKKASELDMRVAHIEKLVLKPGINMASDAPESLGAQFAKSEMFKALVNGQTSRARMNFKTITTLPPSGTPVGGVAVPPQFAPMVAPPVIPLMLRDIIPIGRTQSNLIEYVRESGYTNSASHVPETTQKPESDLTFALIQAPVATMAHWILASKQVLADVPQLESYINGRLIFGLKRVEESELLRGDGSGGSIFGFMEQVPTAAAGATTTLDAIRFAKTEVEMSGYIPNAVVMNPVDWQAIDTAKDSLGRYLLSNPTTQIIQPLWGMRTIVSVSMQAGEFLLGDFNMSQIWDREDANVMASTEDRDNFIKNMVTLLCEERIALAIYALPAFRQGAVLPPGGGTGSTGLAFDTGNTGNARGTTGAPRRG